MSKMYALLKDYIAQINVCLTAGAIVLAILSLSPQTARAQSPLVFGGWVYSTPCTCNLSYSFVVINNPTVGGAFEYMWGSQLYNYRNLPMSRVGLGLYNSATGACLMIATPCVTVTTYGTIDKTTGSGA